MSVITTRSRAQSHSHRKAQRTQSDTSQRERGIRRNQPILPDISATFEGHSFKATLGYRVKFKASMGNLVRPYLNTDC